MFTLIINNSKLMIESLVLFSWKLYSTINSTNYECNDDQLQNVAEIVHLIQARRQIVGSTFLISVQQHQKCVTFARHVLLCVQETSDQLRAIGHQPLKVLASIKAKKATPSRQLAPKSRTWMPDSLQNSGINLKSKINSHGQVTDNILWQGICDPIQ